ncbi:MULTISPECIES: hypothetical protein [Hymenobacter]|uniref:STAS/SEC14 domain-containing protein n=2 Tax=Hymenobacter TaxID=89966 RepID=A0A7Y7PPE5_9BACT|nr:MULTISPECIES: hypothetical protein [Hymenobacter]NVO31548.1 hypothetical protein [Hymenobacter lapidiphilus]NVO83626.1 hypothetical protein [Hymenobacter terrestris]
MVLYHSPDTSLTFDSDSATLLLSYTATGLSVSFGQAYQLALEEMLAQNIGRLLLDLKRNAPPTDDLEELLAPLGEAVARQPDQSLFIAALVSEGQYQYQIGNSLASSSLPPAQVEFNYFTCRHDATQWLSEN